MYIWCYDTLLISIYRGYVYLALISIVCIARTSDSSDSRSAGERVNRFTLMKCTNKTLFRPWNSPEYYKMCSLWGYLCPVGGQCDDCMPVWLHLSREWFVTYQKKMWIVILLKQLQTARGKWRNNITDDTLHIKRTCHERHSDSRGPRYTAIDVLVWKNILSKS